MKICAATGNAGKLRELRRILEAQGHEVVSQKELGITIEPDETGTTFEENALIKAETICKASGLPTIADDSGLCVDALEGAPGAAAATATMRPTTTSCWRICRMSRRNSAVQNLWPLSASSCPPAGT
jgi:non-canonical purine NTP pyrophosphatase (RdgB/HAM1 family)